MSENTEQGGTSLRDRIADALYQWTLAAAGGGTSRPPNETALRENSLARADAVMGVVGPEIADRDKRIRDLDAQLAIAQAADTDVNETLLTGIGGEHGAATINLRPPRELMAAIVKSLISILDGAPNYAEMEASEAGSPDRYVVRLQRAEKPTPHELRREAEAKLARVRELHRPYRFAGDETTDFCEHCNRGGNWVPYPCPTVRTIDGSTDE